MARASRPRRVSGPGDADPGAVTEAVPASDSGRRARTAATTTPGRVISPTDDAVAGRAARWRSSWLGTRTTVSSPTRSSASSAAAMRSASPRPQVGSVGGTAGTSSMISSADICGSLTPACAITDGRVTSGGSAAVTGIARWLAAGAASGNGSRIGSPGVEADAGNVRALDIAASWVVLRPRWSASTVPPETVRARGPKTRPPPPPGAPRDEPTRETPPGAPPRRRDS